MDEMIWSTQVEWSVLGTGIRWIPVVECTVECPVECMRVSGSPVWCVWGARIPLYPSNPTLSGLSLLLSPLRTTP